MATAPKQPAPTLAEVDVLVDENASRVDVPNASPIKVAGEHEATVGATGPTNWWLYGTRIKNLSPLHLVGGDEIVGFLDAGIAVANVIVGHFRAPLVRFVAGQRVPAGGVPGQINCDQNALAAPVGTPSARHALV